MEGSKVLKYLIDKKETIANLEVLPRKIEIKPTKNFIVSIIGPRRAGKTYFLYHLIKNELKLKEEEFIFMDFEDAQLIDASFKDILEAVSAHEEEYGKKPKYIFLDEVQTVENWNSSVRTLFESKDHFIFISGSSSKLLSKELSTSLRGRTITYSILPFSFSEYLSYQGFEFKKTYSTSQENQIKNYLRTYLKKGGFPDIVIEEELADKFFDEYIDLIVFRDVIERHNIKNTFAVKFLIKSLTSSFSREFSVHKVFNDLKSQGIKVSKKTLYNYISYLEDAFFSFSLSKFSYSMKSSELSLPRVFINDTGLINLVLLDFSENIGNLMENAVFLELLRKSHKDRKLKLFYWKSEGKEVDFVIKKGTDIRSLIQVCYSVEDKETKEREIGSLIKASESLNCSNLIVLTWDYKGEEEFEVNKSKKKIKFVPLWEWLLNRSSS